MQINRITPACRELASGLQFPEGRIALPDGSVIVVEMRRQTLSRVTPGGQVEIVAELGGGPNGAALGPDGRLYVADNGGPGWIVDAEGNSLPVGQADDNHGGSIQRVEPRTGKVETIAATAGRSARPTTWCSTITGASGSRISASTAPMAAPMPAPIVGASTMPARMARGSNGRSSRSITRTGSGCHRTAG